MHGTPTLPTLNPTMRAHAVTWGTNPNPLGERPAFPAATGLLVWTQNPYLADAGPLGPGPEGPHPTVRPHAVTSGTNPNPLRERPAFLQVIVLVMTIMIWRKAGRSPKGFGIVPQVTACALTLGFSFGKVRAPCIDRLGFVPKRYCIEFVGNQNAQKHHALLVVFVL